VGVEPACEALSVSRATFYRRQAAQRPAAPLTTLTKRPAPPRTLSAEERHTVLETLNSPQFVDHAPAEVYARLLDEGTYLCSIRTMYRLLDQHHEVRERRDQLQHPQYHKPELLATAPGQVWSWDITKLLGPAKWTYFHLYVVLDIFSRYVVGWLLAHRECAGLARRLIGESCQKQQIDPGQLTIHSDRGSPMKSQTVAQLLATLGVVRSLSRPHVSNDNPFSESQFKTLKYQGAFPDRFASFDVALAFCQEFFPWYNDEHYHSGLGLLTPASVHFGQTPAVLAGRAAVLTAAYAQHPERFVHRPPAPTAPPLAVWINPPNREEEPVPTLNIPRNPTSPRNTKFVPQVSQNH
jgi:putative transposase